MLELAKKFIDKKCIIYTFDHSQIVGILRQVSDSGVLVEGNSAVEAVNLDFIVRIREYPRNKKGKEKSLHYKGDAVAFKESFEKIDLNDM